MALTVVGIGGTTRDNSSSERALRTALAAAEKYGAETELFAADALDLPDTAVRSDKARHLVKALARCDAVIIASPGYHGAVRPGQERTGLRRRPA